MKTKDVNFFNKTNSQLQQLHGEMCILSKSKPDNPINEFKLGFINEKLGESNLLLTGDFKPFKEFTLFDADKLPSNSDVVMVLSQYLDRLEAWRCSNIRFNQVDYDWYWVLEDDDHLKAKAPK